MLQIALLSEIESNPFDGIESGWWSKGEVKRNQVGLGLKQMRFFILVVLSKTLKLIYFKERREIANGGQMVSGGNWNQRPPSRQRVSRKLGALEVSAFFAKNRKKVLLD